MGDNRTVYSTDDHPNGGARQPPYACRSSTLVTCRLYPCPAANHWKHPAAAPCTHCMLAGQHAPIPKPQHRSTLIPSPAVLLKFVADVAGDLSKGTLSAAKLRNQRADVQGRITWDVTWIDLGRGGRGCMGRICSSERCPC